MEQITESNTIMNNSDKENAASLNQPLLSSDISSAKEAVVIAPMAVDTGKVVVVTSPSDVAESSISTPAEEPSTDLLAPPVQAISEPTALPPVKDAEMEEKMDIEADKKEEEESDKRTPRSTRVKKSVERYDGGQVSVVKTPTAAVEGNGQRLGEFEGITHEISKKLASDDIVILLHRILYGRPGEASKRKAEIRNFRGFGASVEQANIVTRMAKPTVAELRSICHILNLKESGEKSVIIERISEFLTDPKAELLKPATSSSAKKTPTRKRAASTTPNKRGSASKKTPSSKTKETDAEAEPEPEDEDVPLKTPSKKTKVIAKTDEEVPVVAAEEEMEQAKDVVVSEETVEEAPKAEDAMQVDKNTSIVEEVSKETENAVTEVPEEPKTESSNSEPTAEEPTAEEEMPSKEPMLVATPTLNTEIFSGSSPSNEEITLFVTSLLKVEDLNEITKGKVRTSIMEKFGISETLMTEKKVEINVLIDQVINTLQ